MMPDRGNAIFAQPEYAETNSTQFESAGLKPP